MRTSLTWAAMALVAAACGGPAAPAEESLSSAPAIPIESYRLDNGLRVVLSQDTSAPVATVAVYYDIGFRLEERGRTGFAHLFEHMMFQSSENLAKNEFIALVQNNGGSLNGSTRFDFTNYFETIPSHALETILWAEADRMRGLDVTEENLVNQQAVVSNEVRVNVLNQPYGGFPWLDMPQAANENWYNAHNFYGDLSEIEAATLDEVQRFFDLYYAPNNAALVVVGDFDPAQTRAWIEQYFGPIPAGEPTEKPDISEPRQEAEKTSTRVDPLANRPAVAVGYKAPLPNTPEYYALAVIEQILSSGRDSRLFARLVQEAGLTGNVSSSLNAIGNLYNINGPTLYTVWMLYDDASAQAEILAAIDEETARLRDEPVTPEALDRALVKLRSGFYSTIESGFGRADLLAAFTLFSDDPGRINDVEATFARVTPELIQQVAREYLRPTNRTVLTVQPGGQS